MQNVIKEKENFLLSEKETQKLITMNKQVSGESIMNKVREMDRQEKAKVNNKTLIKEYSDGGQNYHIFEGSVEEMYLNQIKNKEELQQGSLNKKEYEKYFNVKLVGPIEELALFTIKDFRNLSSNISLRISKIETKIKVLGSYSTRKKVLGIRAWLMSEVCRVYKEMIDESVKFGGITRVINMRKERAGLYLTEEEVEAVAELNRKLRI